MEREWLSAVGESPVNCIGSLDGHTPATYSTCEKKEHAVTWYVWSWSGWGLLITAFTFSCRYVSPRSLAEHANQYLVTAPVLCIILPSHSFSWQERVLKEYCVVLSVGKVALQPVRSLLGVPEELARRIPSLLTPQPFPRGSQGGAGPPFSC